jgi:hypothetical protein
VDRDLFRRRVRDSGLSLWELGDLLGVHPHQLHNGNSFDFLPARVIAELARRLDLHPADLVDAYPTATDQMGATVAESGADLTDHALDGDALAVLSGLAVSRGPLTIEEVVTALSWTVNRVTAALDHAATHPRLGGPIALHRSAGDTWAVHPRLDLLSADQRRDLADAATGHEPLTVEEAVVLLAAHAFGGTPDWTTWRQAHLDVEHRLKTRGLLLSENGPHHARPSDEVHDGLDRVFARPGY